MDSTNGKGGCGVSISVEKMAGIVIQDERLRPAAEKLAFHLKPLMDTPLCVTTEPLSPCLFVSVDNTLPDGYTIKASGDNVCIFGANLAQTVRGVYAFLSEVCGIRYFTKKGATYTNATTAIPADLDLAYSPAFEFTETDWLSPRDSEYALFNQLNGAAYRAIPNELGGAVQFLPRMAHTFTSHFCKAKTYFADHPEYFALRGGKRTPKQLCLSNPDVLNIVTDEVLDLLKEKHDPTAPLQIVSLSQADNLSFCRCPACRETDKKHGSHAGTMLTFVNAVARAVKAAGYENVVLATYAYQYSRKPPKDLVPEDNVMIMTCSIECCFSHPLESTSCKTNREFQEDLRGWAAICRRIYMWDYTTNYSHFVGLFPNFGVLSPNIRFFKENNVKGIYEEGNYTLKTCDPEFAELRAYLITRLFRDPYCDLQKEREAFLASYYGDGGEAIGRFLDIITQNAPKRHVGIFQSMGQTLALSRKDRAACEALWNEAEAAATGDALQNVKNSRLSWRYWKMKNRCGEFKNPFTYRRKKQALIDDATRAGVTRWHEAGKTRTFFVSLYQTLFFRLRPLAGAVVKFLYRL